MIQMKKILNTFLLVSLSISIFSCSTDEHVTLDSKLRQRVQELGLQPLNNSRVYNVAQVELGKMLYFDKILSGNQDIACSTCHHPLLGTTDNLPLPIGTKGVGLGKNRIKDPTTPFVARNAPDVFNKGLKQWKTMFWDARIEEYRGELLTPAKDEFPEGVKNVLAAQALFPPTAQVEMKGYPGDNEISDHQDFNVVWSLLKQRIFNIPEYRQMFKNAYGDREYTLADIANAIEAYESYYFTFTNTPWDNYLKGNIDLLSDSAKRGALFFYGDGRCYTCHSGNLFTDQKFHNVLVPQFCPGKNVECWDYGRYNVTGIETDKFKFRTPSLRGVELTFPYMHNGAYKDLRSAVKHMCFPYTSLKNYDPYENDLPEEIVNTVKNSPQEINEIESTSDITEINCSVQDINNLIEFLKTLTDPLQTDEDYLKLSIPDHVPSGLPIDSLE